jgi:hypothetical protein
MEHPMGPGLALAWLAFWACPATAFAVVTVPVKRGVVTLVVLDADESITEVAAGLGGDCAKAESAWCVAAQPGGRNFFVKAKSSASAANRASICFCRANAFEAELAAGFSPFFFATVGSDGLPSCSHNFRM